MDQRSERNHAKTISNFTELMAGCPAAPPEVFLIVRHGDQVSLIDVSEPGERTVGRASGADIVLDDPRVSRLHAKLGRTGGTLVLEDLGSLNGTMHNGHPLRGCATTLAVGDVVVLGYHQLIVGARSPSAAVPCLAGPATGPRVDAVAAPDDAADPVVADPEMGRILARLRKVARMPTTVLLVGETGTGKDVLAHRLHAESARRALDFVRINCAGIPDALVESELFGYERGAFTGAERRKAGYFEAAAGGTVFLDEVGELSPIAQGKLLHVLENRTIVRLGGTQSQPVDVRIVCATHRDLQAMVAEGRFREDLYFRISPFVIRIPPLRDRPAEIPLLANVFLGRLAVQVDCRPPPIAPEAIAMLRAYRWPGNVRELRNAVEYAFAMMDDPPLRCEHFASEIVGDSARGAPPRSHPARMAVIERNAIEEALAAESGNQTRAAARLGMPRRTLVYKLGQYRRERW
jgi:transcriptional regulator of acetoin/glycerol metabolism